jgi:hypothetical protein
MAPQDKLEAFERKHRTGLITILFTDMVGSTALKQQLGDKAASDRFRQHHLVIRETLRLWRSNRVAPHLLQSFPKAAPAPSRARGSSAR